MSQYFNNVFMFLCDVKLFRTLRLSVEGIGTYGLTLSMAALRAPVASSPDLSVTSSDADTTVTSPALVTSLYRMTSQNLASQELTSHLVSLLGALLLQDASRASSRGRREDSTPSSTTTPTRSFGAAGQAGSPMDVPSLPAPMLVVCHELLVTLNSSCCFDLETAQKLPQDLKV
jgi:hypothetical protein